MTKENEAKDLYDLYQQLQEIHLILQDFQDKDKEKKPANKEE